MLRKLSIVLILIYTCTNQQLLAQENKPWSGFGVESNFMANRLIKHSSKFVGEMPDWGYSCELNFFKKTYGQKDWHIRRNYPQIGFGIYYNNYNSPDIYGEAIGIFPNIQFPIIKSSTLEWTVRAGMGVCYVTQHYQRLPEPNLGNQAIGGNWNNISPFSTDIRWYLDNHWNIQAGINFSHVSNAAFQQPNLGLNMYGIHAGLQYFPISNQPKLQTRALTPLKNRWLFQAKYSMGFVESAPPDGPLNPVYIGSLFVSKRYWSKNKMYSGIDYHYNSMSYARLKTAEHEEGKEVWASSQAAIFVGNEFLLGRVGVVLQVGGYIHRMNEQTERLYQKLGGNFYLVQKEKGPVKEVFFSALLKTHLATAELFEMGLGIGL